MTHKCNTKVLKNVKSKEKVRFHTNFFLNMLHSLIIQVKVPLSIKQRWWNFDVYKSHLLFGLLIDHIWNLKMDALTSFIVVIIAITIQFSLYAIKRLQEPLEPNYLIDKNSKKNKNYTGKFWKNAEITNGRLAMIGFLALIINYGLFGWIIPGFI